MVDKIKNNKSKSSSAAKFKRILKWIFILCFGVALAIAYTYILNDKIVIETTAMFFILYAYMVLFIKFLIRIFK